MSAELQDLIDDLAQELDRPISLEDRRWQLVAFSAQQGEIDPVRRASIMRRCAPTEIVEFLETQALDGVVGATHVEAVELGMQMRTCLPLRQHDVVLGFLWVIDGRSPLGAAEHTRLAEVGAAVAEVLWEARRRGDSGRGQQAEIVGELLSAPDPRPAATALAAELGWPAEGPYVAAVGSGTDAEVAELVRRRWPQGELLASQWEGHPLVIAHLTGGATGDDLASVLHASGAGRAAAGGAVGSLAEIRDSVDQTTLATRIARATGDPSPAVCFDSLDEGWKLVAEIWSAADQPGPPAAILALEQHRQADVLLDTLEATLDSNGDLSAAAAQLHMHRATLYRRLERIEAITGLDLSRCDGRLLAHVGLRLRRLSQAADDSRDAAPLGAGAPLG